MAIVRSSLITRCWSADPGPLSYLVLIGEDKLGGMTDATI